MTVDKIPQAVILAAAVAGALALLWKHGRNAWRTYRAGRAKITAVGDAILGREAVVDTITGKEIAPALPGMGVRMAHQEQQMEAITAAVTRLASQQEAIVELKRGQDEHEERLQRLEQASVERVVTKAESAAAWRAVEAVAKSGDADPEAE